MSRYSIVLPVRNGGEYLKLCVNSILSQKVNDFILHVLDSGSTDGTIEWLQTLVDSRVDLHISEKPLTIEENWARAVSIKKNEYMTLIGHDDILKENFLEIIERLIQNHPNASLYTSHFDFIDSKGNLIQEAKKVDKIESGPQFLKKILLNQVDIMGTGYVMRSSDYDYLNGIPLYPNLLYADVELWLNLTRIGYKVVAQEKLFSFRIHQSTTTVSSDIKYQKALERVVKYFNSLKQDADYRQILEAHFIEFIRYNCKGLAHRLLRTEIEKRDGLSVKMFIERCKDYADMLIPNNSYHPESQFSVRVAKWLDGFKLTRNLFLWFKRHYRKPIIK